MADLNLGTYSPEDMICVITANNVSHIVSGWAEGSFVSVDRVSPSSVMVKGATRNGNLRVIRNDDAGTVTFTVTQSSYDNDVLSALWRADKETRDSTWLFNMTLIDGTGRSYFNCRECYIENMPTGSYGTDAENRTWTIHALQLDEYIGGNAKIPADVVETLEKLGITVADRWQA